MSPNEFNEFCERFMAQSGNVVPARLQAALALLERLYEHPSLKLSDHLLKSGAGIVSHEKYGGRVHRRFGLEAINKNHGRRASNIADWGQPLLNRLRGVGLDRDSGPALLAVQSQFAETLRSILESEPLTVRVKGRSAEAVVADLLKQADDRNKAGTVAQYLVGAKLQLRFPQMTISVNADNKGDRRFRGDESARLADFEVAQAAIEVALGTPDEKHIEQVRQVLTETDKEVWLLVRGRRATSWQDEIAELEPSFRERVVVVAIEKFIGQNITELGTFSEQGKGEQLAALFALYNDVWIAHLGPPNLRIVTK